MRVIKAVLMILIIILGFIGLTWYLGEHTFDPRILWNLKNIQSLPLNTSISEPSVKQTLYENLVKEYNVTFVSEIIGDEPIKIFGVLLIPHEINSINRAPAVLLVHGYGQTHISSMLRAALLSREGYISFAIDLPGSGLSTGPALTIQNYLNVTSPRNSYFYRGTIAIIRALQFLSTRSEIESLGLMGVSLGGWLTFIVNAIDPSLSAACALIASGGFNHSAIEGKQIAYWKAYVSPDDWNSFLRFFDPIHFTPYQQSPLYMSIGTDDEFASLHSINLTYSTVSNKKAITLIANGTHELYGEMIYGTLFWFDSFLKQRNALPNIISTNAKYNYTTKSVSIELKTSISTAQVKIFYSTEIGENGRVGSSSWRSVNASLGPVSTWQSNIPLERDKIIYFISLVDNSTRYPLVITSQVFLLDVNQFYHQEVASSSTFLQEFSRLLRFLRLSITMYQILFVYQC